MTKFQNLKDHCVRVRPIINANNFARQGAKMFYVLEELGIRDTTCVNNPIINVNKSVLSKNAKKIVTKNSNTLPNSLIAAILTIHVEKSTSSATSNAVKDNLTIMKTISVKAVMAANTNACFAATNVLQKITFMMISLRKSKF